MKKRKVDDGLFEKEVEVLSPEEEAQREREQAWFAEQYPELAGSATLSDSPQYFRALKAIIQRVKDALLFVNGAAVHGPVYLYAIPENYPEGPHRQHDLVLVDRLLEALEKHQPGDCGSAYRIGMLNGELRARLGSYHVQRGRKAKQDHKNATAIATEVRVSTKEEGYEVYRAHYEKIKKSHTKWTDDQIFKYISTTYGPPMKEFYGIGASKATVRRAVLGE